MSILDPLNSTTLSSGALGAAEASIDTLLGVVGVTLSQAQTSKANFADAIFHAKRQAPIALTVSGTAYTWDARDESVNALNAAVLSAFLVAAGVGLSGLATAINSALSSLASSVTTGLGDAITTAVIDGGGLPDTITAPTVPASAFSLSLEWTPIGLTAPVALAGTDVAALISAIATRRATLQGIRLTARATIAGALNVAAVIAASVSAGWP